MAAVTVKRMRELEQEAIGNGLSEEVLMKRAGFALGKAIGEQFRNVGTAVVFIGKGHNAGDALIALKVLEESFGWKVGIRACFPRAEWAVLTQAQWDRDGSEGFLENGFEKGVSGPLLIIDALLGIGAEGALREPLIQFAEEMNRLRSCSGATVVAVDNPSGVDPDHGEIHKGAVIADRTMMIGAAKRGLLGAKAVNAVGSLALVSVEGLQDTGVGGLELISPQTMDFGKQPRPFDFHKGRAGRVGIVAGSSTFAGAALISVLGALKAGGGLVTLCARTSVCEAVRSRMPLEAMLEACDDPSDLMHRKFDSLVVGPGLGDMSDRFLSGLKELLNQTNVGVVVDADALTCFSDSELRFDGRHLLTPHPGEFSRMNPKLSEKSREVAVQQYLKDSNATLLLKGERTVVGKQGKALRLNSTGTPAMSNGGQGDLLSGVLGALLAGGMDPFDAASLGAWACGHAAELVVAESGDLCTATDVARKVPEAMRNWRQGAR